jgi:hypothetical protein
MLRRDADFFSSDEQSGRNYERRFVSDTLVQRGQPAGYPFIVNVEIPEQRDECGNVQQVGHGNSSIAFRTCW